MKSNVTPVTKKSAVYLVSLLVLFLLVACQPNNNTWERIEESGVLGVGLDPTYPPFEVAEGGDLRGLDVDLARTIARDLGLRAEFVYFGYDGLYDALATEQVDVLISALVITPERMRDFAYSDSYFNAGQILMAPASSTDITEMADLNGRTLAVELGAQGHVEATEWERRLPDLTVQPYNSPDEALAAVANGEAEAVLIDSISGRLYLKNEPALKRVGQPVTVEPFAFVVRIEDELLLEKLNESLANLRASGQLGEIINRWLGK